MKIESMRLEIIVDFLNQMKPGDEIRKIKKNGKIGFELATAENNGNGCFEIELIETGEYGYFLTY